MDESDKKTYNEKNTNEEILNEKIRILDEVVNSLSTICNNHIQELNTVNLILQELKKLNEINTHTINEVNQIDINDEPSLTKLEKYIQDANDDHQKIIDRQIAYHKENGTYSQLGKTTQKEKEKKEEIKKEETQVSNKGNVNGSVTDKKVPMLNPLYTIDNNTLEKITKELFQEAVFNIGTLLCVDRSDPTFKQQVNEEADRLLQVWVEKKKKSSK